MISGAGGRRIQGANEYLLPTRLQRPILSGGNCAKVVLSKWLCHGRGTLILDETHARYRMSARSLDYTSSTRWPKE